jgi:hypothetical protein
MALPLSQSLPVASALAAAHKTAVGGWMESDWCKPPYCADVLAYKQAHSTEAFASVLRAIALLYDGSFPRKWPVGVFYAACQNDDLEAVEFLAAGGSPTGASSSSSSSSSPAAAAASSPPAAAFDIFDQRQSAFHAACSAGSASVVQWFTRQPGLRIDEAGSGGGGVYSVASGQSTYGPYVAGWLQNRERCLRILVDAGARAKAEAYSVHSCWRHADSDAEANLRMMRVMFEALPSAAEWRERRHQTDWQPVLADAAVRMPPAAVRDIVVHFECAVSPRALSAAVFASPTGVANAGEARWHKAGENIVFHLKREAQHVAQLAKLAAGEYNALQRWETLESKRASSEREIEKAVAEVSERLRGVRLAAVTARRAAAVAAATGLCADEAAFIVAYELPLPCLVSDADVGDGATKLVRPPASASGSGDDTMKAWVAYYAAEIPADTVVVRKTALQLLLSFHRDARTATADDADDAVAQPPAPTHFGTEHFSAGAVPRHASIVDCFANDGFIRSFGRCKDASVVATVLGAWMDHCRAEGYYAGDQLRDAAAEAATGKGAGARALQAVVVMLVDAKRANKIVGVLDWRVVPPSVVNDVALVRAGVARVETEMLQSGNLTTLQALRSFVAAHRGDAAITAAAPPAANGQFAVAAASATTTLSMLQLLYEAEGPACVTPPLLAALLAHNSEAIARWTLRLPPAVDCAADAAIFVAASAMGDKGHDDGESSDRSDSLDATDDDGKESTSFDARALASRAALDAASKRRNEACSALGRYYAHRAYDGGGDGFSVGQEMTLTDAVVFRQRVVALLEEWTGLRCALPPFAADGASVRGSFNDGCGGGDWKWDGFRVAHQRRSVALPVAYQEPAYAAPWYVRAAHSVMVNLSNVR